MMLRKWLLKVIRGLDWLDRGIAWSWWLFIAAALLVTWEVVMRYFFNAPHTWFEEISVLAVVGACMLGAGRATREVRHISLELLYARLKGGRRRAVDLVQGITIIAASVVLLICLLMHGLFLDGMNVIYESTLKTPFSLVVYAVAVGMALNAIYGLGIVLRASLGIPSGKEAME